jgi:hypothetical protein
MLEFGFPDEVGVGLSDELAGYADSAVVACVGHEPDLSRFAARRLHADGAVTGFPRVE